MQTELQAFLRQNEQELYSLLRELCLIPAPSHHEDARAAFCKSWLENVGAKGVYIDEAKNVIFPLNCENSREITVVVAHTDTVFPDTEPMPYREENGRIYCPGVGDDTVSVAQLMLTAKFFSQNALTPKGGILFVCNSCEEGLGNLLGTRTVMRSFEGRVKQFLSLDSFTFKKLTVGCVGSHRYEVETHTAGGHSFGAFGNRNAALSLAEIISAIYQIEVPAKPGTKTTYNVGTIEGGTSVNTIPQSAKMLCEYRSNDRECLAIMKAHFERIFAAANSEHTRVTVKQVGERPCEGDVDAHEVDRLAKICADVIKEVTGNEVTHSPGSTDCNIPLSMGIPSVCFPTYEGKGAHTREESLEKSSILPGLEIAVKIIAKVSEVQL